MPDIHTAVLDAIAAEGDGQATPVALRRRLIDHDEADVHAAELKLYEDGAIIPAGEHGQAWAIVPEHDRPLTGKETDDLRDALDGLADHFASPAEARDYLAAGETGPIRKRMRAALEERQAKVDMDPARFGERIDAIIAGTLRAIEEDVRNVQASNAAVLHDLLRARALTR